MKTYENNTIMAALRLIGGLLIEKGPGRAEGEPRENPGRAQGSQRGRRNAQREPEAGQGGPGRGRRGAVDSQEARKCGRGRSNQALVDPGRAKVQEGSAKSSQMFGLVLALPVVLALVSMLLLLFDEPVEPIWAIDCVPRSKRDTKHRPAQHKQTFPGLITAINISIIVKITAGLRLIGRLVI